MKEKKMRRKNKEAEKGEKIEPQTIRAVVEL